MCERSNSNVATVGAQAGHAPQALANLETPRMRARAFLPTSQAARLLVSRRVSSKNRPSGILAFASACLLACLLSGCIDFGPSAASSEQAPAETPTASSEQAATASPAEAASQFASGPTPDPTAEAASEPQAGTTESSHPAVGDLAFEPTADPGLAPGSTAATDPNLALDPGSAPDPNIGQLDIAAIPFYTDQPAIEVNSGYPFFTEVDLARDSFEEYSPLDDLGRCGPAFALIGPETMPTDEKRGQIGNVRPSGWHYDRYDWIDGKYLFNRCHLIAWMLAAENDNVENLITGTRNMNTRGMLPYEEQVAHYVWRTGNHVLYRSTPVFEGDNALATGVLLEAQSVEDGGAGVKFCVFCYNAEPGVGIDYATGNNWSTGTRSLTVPREGEESQWGQYDFIVNTNSGKFHLPGCPSVEDMSERNKLGSNETAEELLARGYAPCGVCKPAG